MKLKRFQIQNLDHVAIHVRDMDLSASWYEKVLGLERITTSEWGGIPIYMLSGKTGVAIFPAKLDDPYLDPQSENIKIDHFAFKVSDENYKKALEHLDELAIAYIERDHHYFQSLYLEDPDGHTVELTTLKVNAKDFYNE